MGSSREHAATKTVDDFDLAAGHGALQLKTPWRNGTTHVEWDAVDCIAELAALVPPPRAHFTRVHGVFAPHADLRTQLTPPLGCARPASWNGWTPLPGLRHYAIREAETPSADHRSEGQPAPTGACAAAA